MGGWTSRMNHRMKRAAVALLNRSQERAPQKPCDMFACPIPQLSSLRNYVSPEPPDN